MKNEEFISRICKVKFFNKSDNEIIDSFYRGCASFIERADELRFMPNVLFNYFIRFVIEREHDPFDKDDIFSCVIGLLEEKLAVSLLMK